MARFWTKMDAVGLTVPAAAVALVVQQAAVNEIGDDRVFAIWFWTLAYVGYAVGYIALGWYSRSVNPMTVVVITFVVGLLSVVIAMTMLLSLAPLIVLLVTAPAIGGFTSTMFSRESYQT